MNTDIFAAIDIGSNAMRLLITNIVEQEGKETQFNKSALIRVPIRLGQDAFTVGEISEENIDRMVDAMQAFRLLMKVYKVENFYFVIQGVFPGFVDLSQIQSRFEFFVFLFLSALSVRSVLHESLCRKGE